MTDFFDNVGGGAGAPTARLKDLNDGVIGEIVEFSKRDYVPFGKTEPEKDPSEEDGIRKQMVIVLQTDQRNWAGVSKIPKVDPQDPNSAEKDPSEDDGRRAVYAPNRSNIQWAIGKALQEAKAKFEVGATLGVKIVNLKDTGKGNPLKEHVAKFEKKAANDGFFGSSDAPANEAPSSPEPTKTAEATPAASAPAASQPQDPWATGGTSSTQPPF